MMVVRIVNLERRHADELATIHQKAFPSFFLTSLGRPFLFEFYRGFVGEESAVTAIAVSDSGAVLGGAVGTINPEGFFRRLLVRRGPGFAWASLRAVLRRPSSMGRLLRAVTYRGGPGVPEGYALLSSICIDPNTQGTGLGGRVLSTWVEGARRAGAAGAVLTTDALGNEGVNRFYRSNGWQLADQYETRERRLMNQYRLVFENSWS